MRTYLTIIFICFLPLWSSAESISQFHVDITVNPDASLSIVESITYDFNAQEKHGIFRYVPLVYSQPGTSTQRVITISDITVLRNFKPEPYVSEQESDYLFIRIGDPESTISSRQSYTISYHVEGALRYFQDHDELYWNLTGDAWEVPLNSVSAEVFFSEGEFIDTRCFYGPASATSTCTSQTTAMGASFGGVEQAGPVTIAASFQKGLVPEVVFTQEPDQSMYYILAGLFASLISFVGLYIRSLRTHYRKQPVITQYEPYNNQRAIFTGTLEDGRVDSRDIVAGLLSLARDGYIALVRQESTRFKFFNSQDWQITLLREIDSSLLKAETTILTLLFGSTPAQGSQCVLSKVVNHTNKAAQAELIRTLRADLQQDLLSQGYQEPFWGGTRWNKKGYQARNHIKGFKRFLSVTEQERYRFHNAPDKSPEQFMQFLPYAIALGVEQEWTQQFGGIDISHAHGYISGMNSLHASELVGELNSFAHAFQVELSHASVSSNSGVSGGSSGGGFGGGGGGSW